MAAFYGLRRSGIMGLRWSAIDFEGNTLTVDHTVVQYRSDGKNRMKNKSSCRTMPPVPQYRELLLRMQERKAACKEFCGNCYTESEYIYVNELGIPYKPNFVSDHFKRVLKQHGLRPIRFHDFRYTCASLLLKNGVAVKDIQDWLGLSSYATTANIYAHLDTDSKKQPATKMNQTVSITPGISAAIQAGGENSGREPGFKKKILRFSIHEKPEYFQLSCVDKKDAALKALQRNGFRPPCFFSSLFLKNTLGNANPLPCQCRIIFRLFCIVQIALIL